jgi:hypothetical protein
VQGRTLAWEKHQSEREQPEVIQIRHGRRV